MKRGKHPTSSRRNRKQKILATYQKAREDAQLAGVIPTEPVGAAKDNERTKSASQFDDALPELVREALKDGWSVPDSAKPAIIAALLEPFFKDEIVFDETGKAHTVKPSKKLLNEIAKTLRMLDQTQYERDNPEAAGKAKGGTNIQNVNAVQNNVDMASMIREMVESGQLGLLEEMRTSSQSGALSYGRQQREVQGSGTPTTDEQCAGESVEDSQQ